MRLAGSSYHFVLFVPRSVRRVRLALRNKVKEEEHLEIYGGLRGEVGMELYLHGPMDYVKTLKLRFRVGDLDLPQRRIPVIGRRKMNRCALVANI